MDGTNAPLSELRVASAVRLYERIKLGLVVLVLVVDIAIGVYLIAIGVDLVALARTNQETLVTDQQSLTILRCAVDRSVQVDPHGHRRSQDQQRVVFDACVKRGHP